MFFIGGIGSSSKELLFGQSIVCPHCERLGNLKVVMTYMYFSFFFIPLFRWGKKYYAQSSCCHTLFPIPDDLGKSIEKGEAVTLQDTDLSPCDTSNCAYATCHNCGYPLSVEFDFCPKCGKKL